MADGTNAGGAEVYWNWLNGNLDQLRERLPAITRSAEEAAKAYVQDGYEIAAFGEDSIVSEAGGRAGGLMAMRYGNATTGAKGKTIILIFPRQKMIEKDLAVGAQFLSRSNMVIAFARAPVLAAATNAGIKFSAVIETSDYPHGGVLMAGPDQWTVPADPALNMAALWVWTGEFVAACTRLGKMPPMYQSFVLPGGKDRATKFGKVKFHDEAPQAIKAGQLGLEYLQAVKSNLASFHERELAHLRTVAAQAADAIRSGHTAYVSARGHASINLLAELYAPGFFRPLSDGWTPVKKGVDVKKGDFIYGLAYDSVLPDVMAAATNSGAGISWSMTDYRRADVPGPATVPAGQVVIDQGWEYGDAAIALPGYNVKVLPPSGIVTEASLRMVEAEMVTLLGPAAVKSGAVK